MNCFRPWSRSAKPIDDNARRFTPAFFCDNRHMSERDEFRLLPGLLTGHRNAITGQSDRCNLRKRRSARACKTLDRISKRRRSFRRRLSGRRPSASCLAHKSRDFPKFRWRTVGTFCCGNRLIFMEKRRSNTRASKGATNIPRPNCCIKCQGFFHFVKK